MQSVHHLFLIIAITFATVFAGDSTSDSTKQVNKTEDIGYRIEQPGTITFTVGVKIKGKVEKPQVVIFLLKEKSQYREMSFSYSFQKDIYKPLPFIPIIE